MDVGVAMKIAIREQNINKKIITGGGSGSGFGTGYGRKEW